MTAPEAAVVLEVGQVWRPAKPSRATWRKIVELSIENTVVHWLTIGGKWCGQYDDFRAWAKRHNARCEP